MNEGFEENPVQRLFYQEYLERILKIFEEKSDAEHIENGKNMALEILIFCSRQQMYFYWEEKNSKSLVIGMNLRIIWFHWI